MLLNGVEVRSVNGFTRMDNRRPRSKTNPVTRYCCVTVRPAAGFYDTGTAQESQYELLIRPGHSNFSLHWVCWGHHGIPDVATGVFVTVEQTPDHRERGRAASAEYTWWGPIEPDTIGRVHRRRPFAIETPAVDWGELIAIGRSICAGKSPEVVLDWFMDKTPDPWRRLGELPLSSFFAAVCPIPLATKRTDP